jgi:hypothetical protein
MLRFSKAPFFFPEYRDGAATWAGFDMVDFAIRRLRHRPGADNYAGSGDKVKGMSEAFSFLKQREFGRVALTGAASAAWSQAADAPSRQSR